MDKIEEFRRAIEKIDVESDIDYMSKMENWCAVHVTRYMPRINQNGVMYIPSTAMATNFESPRTTVHVTLNHIVASHAYGSWDDAPIVVLAPYSDVIKQNGNPAEVAGTDTYWSVDPDVGLVLPESAYVIKPDNDGPLFKIDKHGATYKRDNYTTEEIAQIESLLNWRDSEDYEKYKSGDLSGDEIKDALCGDKRMKQMYDAAKDKKAFLRGLFEESRFDILSKYLREIVTQMVMQKIGFRYIEHIHDANEASHVIANAADAQNIPSNASNKGHSNSLYAIIEDQFDTIYRFLHDNVINQGLFDAPDLQTVYDVITKHGLNDAFAVSVVANIINDKPIDFDKLYQDAFTKEVEIRTESFQTDLMLFKNDLKKYMGDDFPHLTEAQRNKEIKRLQDMISRYEKIEQKLSKQKEIAKYDKNLADTVHRHCARLSKEYNAWRERIVKDPEYNELVQKLRNWVVMQSTQSYGRDA